MANPLTEREFANRLRLRSAASFELRIRSTRQSRRQLRGVRFSSRSAMPLRNSPTRFALRSRRPATGRFT